MPRLCGCALCLYLQQPVAACLRTLNRACCASDAALRFHFLRVGNVSTVSLYPARGLPSWYRNRLRFGPLVLAACTSPLLLQCSGFLVAQALARPIGALATRRALGETGLNSVSLHFCTCTMIAC